MFSVSLMQFLEVLMELSTQLVVHLWTKCRCNARLEPAALLWSGRGEVGAVRALTQSQPAQSRSIVSPPRDHRDSSLSQHKSTISEVLMQLRFKKLLIKFLLGFNIKLDC